MKNDMLFISERVIYKPERVTKTIRIDKDLLEIIQEKRLSPSDIINIALERYFKERGWL